MSKKVPKEKNFPSIQSMREQLPGHYLQDLQKLLPSMKIPQIAYIISGKSKNVQKIKAVHGAMSDLTKSYAKQRQQIVKLQGSK